MKKILLSLGIMFLTKGLWATTTPSPTYTQPSVLVSSYAALANIPVTITISSPTGGGAYSTGYTNYISELHIVAYATGTVLGLSTPTVCTMSGFPSGTVSLPFGTTYASVGTVVSKDYTIQNPFAATPGSQVVITCPALAGVIWDMFAGYFVAP